MIRREFLREGTTGLLATLLPQAAVPSPAQHRSGPVPYSFSVSDFGATGDGTTIDSPAVNRAIEAAAAVGGGTVVFPAGTYACYSIRLRSRITLHLQPGAVILAAPVPEQGSTVAGFDAAGPAQAWESFQDFGHSHWPNSLIYGIDLENVAIVGTGLIWGKSLSRGDPKELPRAESPGVGNKAIALKNCRNVTMRDFRMLMGGHFAILLTGVDNVIIDGLLIDTNRDGIDIDCCRNVRVENCAVNSPWDDAICPKSSYALGYARPTENVTITNCYVTGAYEFGAMLDGSWKLANYSVFRKAIGRIKCGTESNGGFRSITISNCVFDRCRGFALESVDGASIEDITVTNIVMRGLVDSPIFLRLGNRMRGPAGVAPGMMRRILLSNISSYDAVAEYPSIIAGIPAVPIEDVKISNVYLHQSGGGTQEWAARLPPENEKGYPDANMFGILPAKGFFLRHAKNVEFSSVEIAVSKPDLRPAIWAEDTDGLDIFRLRAGAGPVFHLRKSKNFRSFGSRDLPDRTLASADNEVF